MKEDWILQVAKYHFKLIMTSKNDDWMLTITVNEILGKKEICECDFPKGQIVAFKHRRTIMGNTVKMFPVFECSNCGLKVLNNIFIKRN